MGEKGHRFGTETLRTGAEELTHEAQVLTHGVMTAPFRLRTYRLIRKILIGFILVSIANVLFSYFFYTPKMYRILRDNRETVIKYRILQDRIRTAQQRVDEIRHRDNYVSSRPTRSRSRACGNPTPIRNTPRSPTTTTPR